MTIDSSLLPPLAEILAYNAGALNLQCEHGVAVTFLRNFTIEGVEPYLAFHCFQNGIRPVIRFGAYDMMMQELVEHSSFLYEHPTDILVLAILLEQLDSAYDEPAWQASVAIERLSSLFQVAAANTASLLVVNTFIPPYDADCGIASGTELYDRVNQVGVINCWIRDFVQKNKSRFILLDWERIARALGELETMDYRFWFMAKAPFKQSFLNLYALEIVKIVRALKGKARKCLLLDCDNTLWGGVVGEDGRTGIQLDRHSYPGNIFFAFQKQLLLFHERGVLLCLVSKNNENDVWEVLDRHPDCLLKRGHLAAWRINWQDKVANIRSIGEELNLGIDSFVFIDDNPTECEMVRAMLPEVKVFQVPAKRYLLPRLLFRDGLFDTLLLTAEDRKRSVLYRAESERKMAESAFSSKEEYLATLGIVAMIRSARSEDVERIAQLTQKTNQFNLTTRRYCSAQIEVFSSAVDAAVFSISVRDRFGDSGLTGVFIAFHEGDIGRIDTFLLSCRILGRNLESVFLNHCLAKLQARWNVSGWLAEYIPSSKNIQTADFYTKAGFSTDQTDATRTIYSCASADREGSTISYIAVKDETDASISRE